MKDEREHGARRDRAELWALFLMAAALFVSAPATLLGRRDEWHLLESLSGLLMSLALLTAVLGELLFAPARSKTITDRSNISPD